MQQPEKATNVRLSAAKHAYNGTLFKFPRELRDMIYLQSLDWEDPVRIWKKLRDWERQYELLEFDNWQFGTDRDGESIPALERHMAVMPQWGLVTPAILLLNREITAEVLELIKKQKRCLTLDLCDPFLKRSGEIPSDITQLIGRDTFCQIMEFDIELRFIPSGYNSNWLHWLAEFQDHCRIFLKDTPRRHFCISVSVDDDRKSLAERHPETCSPYLCDWAVGGLYGWTRPPHRPKINILQIVSAFSKHGRATLSSSTFFADCGFGMSFDWRYNISEVRDFELSD
ncbi:hypothetical protein EV356DRAFT_535833 [Viridothelium virens]|uniref:Uncharacterized protein n=1 Tax=Viridothelium virens TaxID=1048519 RepID=A0A6A6GZT7_VIRVR|nr:hypothetical protein EV356DRAFT_535833 [Viridothelium virens]